MTSGNSQFHRIQVAVMNDVAGKALLDDVRAFLEKFILHARIIDAVSMPHPDKPNTAREAIQILSFDVNAAMINYQELRETVVMTCEAHRSSRLWISRHSLDDAYSISMSPVR